MACTVTPDVSRGSISPPTGSIVRPAQKLRNYSSGYVAANQFLAGSTSTTWCSACLPGSSTTLSSDTWNADPDGPMAPSASRSSSARISTRPATGSHEVTNYLHVRFCPDTASDLCRIVAYNDDQFSHLLFVAAGVVANLAFEEIGLD